ncbi:unnamed protein product [Brassica oleracea var. botrytis]
MNAFINLLRQRYQDHPQHFRSERMCFLDHIFLGSGGPPTLILRATREMPKVLGRRLPGRAWNYHAGEIPSFCQSKKVCGVDVDDIYAPVNFKNQHWFAMDIDP